jgi:hypothetical protein
MVAPGSPRHRKTPGCALLGTLLLLIAGPATAATVYKSVGPEGQVVYGDEPAENAVTVEAIDIPDYDAVPQLSAGERIEQMAATTDRLQEDRREREERRRENRAQEPVRYYPVPVQTERRTYVSPSVWPLSHSLPHLRRHPGHHRDRHDKRDRDRDGGRDKRMDKGPERATWNPPLRRD